MSQKKISVNGTKIIIFIFLTLLVLDIILIALARNKEDPKISRTNTWDIQSIDTVKFSRDAAKEFKDSESFNETIETQIKLIAETGANYVSLGTPYDPEFVPFLNRWVNAARKHNLKIWFRGNFSGWEGWFDYPKIMREEHMAMLQNFILQNPDLFMDGDIFTSCTECENGGPGDPRATGDVTGHREFLIEEHKIAQTSFAKINKKVSSNYYSMNYDVAKLIMDKETSNALGKVIVIDHYVKTPEILASSIKELHAQSEAKIVLGEFGAPIPDIHGEMTNDEQAEWINKALTELIRDENVIGVNYWTNFGGTTRLWRTSGEPTPAVKVLRDFFMAGEMVGIIKNEAGYYVGNVAVASNAKNTTSNKKGIFRIAVPQGVQSLNLKLSAKGYKDKKVVITQTSTPVTIFMRKEEESPFFIIQKIFYKYLGI